MYQLVIKNEALAHHKILLEPPISPIRGGLVVAQYVLFPKTNKVTATPAFRSNWPGVQRCENKESSKCVVDYALYITHVSTYSTLWYIHCRTAPIGCILKKKTVLWKASDPWIKFWTTAGTDMLSFSPHLYSTFLTWTDTELRHLLGCWSVRQLKVLPL